MWTYDQSSGRLYNPEGAWVSSGYSGKGRGKNNPALQHLRGVGPLPRGTYRIGAPRTSQRTGPFVMDLYPIDATPRILLTMPPDEVLFKSMATV